METSGPIPAIPTNQIYNRTFTDFYSTAASSPMVQYSTVKKSSAGRKPKEEVGKLSTSYGLLSYGLVKLLTKNLNYCLKPSCCYSRISTTTLQQFAVFFLLGLPPRFTLTEHIPVLFGFIKTLSTHKKRAKYFFIL